MHAAPTPDPARPDSAAPLLSLRGLTKSFPIRAAMLSRRRHGEVRAVDHVDLDVWPGETVGLVGESGCGKSTLGRLALRLIDPSAGSIRFHDRDLATLARGELKAFRRRMQIVFQDPYASLNPRKRAGDAILDALNLMEVGTPAGPAGCKPRPVQPSPPGDGLPSRPLPYPQSGLERPTDDGSRGGAVVPPGG